MATDIRSNIRQMLEAVRSERRAMRDRDDMLKKREEQLLEWMKEEQPAQGSLNTNDWPPLTAFLLTSLADGKARSTEELSELANNEGLIGPRKSPGRAVNIVMQGLYTRHLVKKISDGRWLKK